MTRTQKRKPAVKEPENHALDQAKLKLESIREMVKELDASDDQSRNTGNDEARDKAETAIHEHPLSVQVRSGWYDLNKVALPANPEPEEYKILLCTGGPAVRIVGTLGKHVVPETARIEYQDWGKPWTEYRISSEDEDILLQYAGCFYYGE